MTGNMSHVAGETFAQAARAASAADGVIRAACGRRRISVRMCLVFWFAALLLVACIPDYRAGPIGLPIHKWPGTGPVVTRRVFDAAPAPGNPRHPQAAPQAGRNRFTWLVSLALPASMTLRIRSGNLISGIAPESPVSKFRRTAFPDGPPGSGGTAPAAARWRGRQGNLRSDVTCSRPVSSRSRGTIPLAARNGSRPRMR